MTSSTLRVKSPADLLALVPCVLGFHPESSLVLVVLDGRTGHLHARVDLSHDPAEARAGVSSLVAAVHRSGARRVALIAYTDDAVLADDTIDMLFDELPPEAEVTWMMRADGRRWYSLDCDDDCCPPEGVPYDVSSHPITAQAVFDGHVVFGSRQELADSLTAVDPDDVEAVGEAADEAMRRFKAASRHPLGMPAPDGARRHLVTEGHWLRDRVRAVLATGEPLDAEEVGRMVVAMVNIEVRDVAWSEMNRSNARRHVELWRDVVRRTPLDLLAAPAGLLGFAAWLAGDGALAWCAVERCQEAEPDYNMAVLLAQALTAAVPPTVWRPIPGDELSLFAG